MIGQRKQQSHNDGGRKGGGVGWTWRVKKLLSGCENAAQPKRLSLG